ncbi:MAG: hypothetical protein D6719_07255 [Candidatus Dadabacteria bacterium]|nr:MAG: hypothetical protein D6719_07255 [Candidatus Dadabacteria bacterium]
MAAKQQTNKSTPPLWGWLLAGISACLVVLLFFAVNYLGNEVELLSEHKLFVKAISRGDIEQAERYLNKLGASGKVLLYSGEVRSNYNILQLVRAGRIRDAWGQFNALHMEKEGVRDYKIPLTKYQAGLIHDIAESFKKLLLAEESLKQAQKKLAEARSRKHQVILTYSLVAKDFGELFSLEPEKATEEINMLPLYPDGFLAGLPRLKEIPTPPLNAEELKEMLDEAGGKVRLRGPDIKEAFDRKISDFRKQLETINQDFLAAHKDVLAALQSFESANEQVLIARKTLTVRLRSMVSEFTRPAVHPISEQIFKNISA